MGKRARQRRPQPGRKQPQRATRQGPRQQVLSKPFPLDAANHKRMDGLARLAELTVQAQRLDAQITEQVDALAAAATSWPAIAQALGVSRQAAHVTTPVADCRTAVHNLVLMAAVACRAARCGC
jgi:hypothetical protein